MNSNNPSPVYFDGPWRDLPRNQTNAAKWCALSSNLAFFDLGSAGGVPPPFCWIPEWTDIVNFEPDPRGASSSEGETLPIAIGPQSMTRIYLNRRPTTSSLLRPCRRIVDRYDFSKIFEDEGDIFETVETRQVQTFGLDEIIQQQELPAPDFLKIDVQGLSFEVLQSASKCLHDSILGVLIEVEFLETYTGQKTFGHIHEFLYENGFEIFKLTNLNKWYYKTDLPIRHVTGQHVFCDLLYFRCIDAITPDDPFWNETRAAKQILLFLLFDLIDTAAAYYERFRDQHIFTSNTVAPIKELITEWEEALYFFYRKNQENKTDRSPEADFGQIQLSDLINDPLLKPVINLRFQASRWLKKCLPPSLFHYIFKRYHKKDGDPEC